MTRNIYDYIPLRCSRRPIAIHTALKSLLSFITLLPEAVRHWLIWSFLRGLLILVDVLAAAAHAPMLFTLRGWMDGWMDGWVDVIALRGDVTKPGKFFPAYLRPCAS
jgi:hypothetical protein